MNFMTKVYLDEMPTIDHKAYSASQDSVSRITRRLSAQRNRAKANKNITFWSELNEKIKKLREIERDLQRALETY